MLGRPTFENSELPVEYGYRSKNNSWHDHAWLVRDELLIDITTDQFDGDSIYCGKINLHQYNPNLTEYDVLHELSTLKNRVNEWLNIWKKHSSNY